MGLSAPRQARGCLRSSWPAEGKPRPAAAQSGLRASQALPAGRGRKSGHGQGRDEPTAEPPANRAEVDVKRMFNEPVQRQVTTKTSVMRHGDVGKVHRHLGSTKCRGVGAIFDWSGHTMCLFKYQLYL